MPAENHQGDVHHVAPHLPDELWSVDFTTVICRRVMAS
jgi:hypothetical protein